MASLVYDSYRLLLANSSGIDLDADTIKMALVTSAYTPNQATHDFFDDVTNEIAGTGYTAGGATISVTTLAIASNQVIFTTATAVNWTSATFTTAAGVIYKDTGTASTSNLICYLDFGGDQTVTAGTFTVEPHATDGYFKIA